MIFDGKGEFQSNIGSFELNAGIRRKEIRSDGIKKGEWLRVQLLSSETLSKFRILPRLFSKQIYIPSITLACCWLFVILIIYKPSRIADIIINLNVLQTLQWAIGIAGVAAFHEFGHASALLYCGGKPGGIGISLCYFLPRGWSEINDVLELTAKERLLVDSGGIYFQLLLSMIMHAVYLTSLKSPALVAIYVSSAIMALINLIPNKGSDGYWMVKDAFGIEDVVQNAKGMIGKSPLNERKKKVQAVLLVAFRNMSIVYLLILILTVFIYALHTITADVAAIICQITALEALRIIWNRLGCLVAIAVVLQNVIASIGKSGRDGRSALEEKGKVR